MEKYRQSRKSVEKLWGLLGSQAQAAIIFNDVLSVATSWYLHAKRPRHNALERLKPAGSRATRCSNIRSREQASERAGASGQVSGRAREGGRRLRQHHGNLNVNHEILGSAVNSPALRRRQRPKQRRGKGRGQAAIDLIVSKEMLKCVGV